MESYREPKIISTVLGDITTTYVPAEKGVIPNMDKDSYYMAHTADGQMWGKGCTRKAAIADLFAIYLFNLQIED